MQYRGSDIFIDSMFTPNYSAFAMPMLRLSNARVWIALLVLPYWFFCANAQAADVDEPFRVMVLRNTSEYLPAAILEDRGMREAFAAKGTRHVELFVETLDTTVVCSLGDRAGVLVAFS